MDHVRSVKFHSCKNLKDLRWKKLLGRADPNFRVTAHTKVCSNHFKYGQPTADDPHSSFYLIGYPGISTSARSKPTRRNLLTLVHLLLKRPGLLVKSVAAQRCLLLTVLLAQEYEMAVNSMEFGKNISKNPG